MSLGCLLVALDDLQARLAQLLAEVLLGHHALLAVERAQAEARG